MREVWVIDDHDAVAESLALLLTTQGVQARPFTSTLEALAQLRIGNEPAVLIIDLKMPGPSVMDYLLSELKHAFPVMVVTGYPDSIDSKAASRTWKVLVKPPDPMELVGLVKQALAPARKEKDTR